MAISTKPASNTTDEYGFERINQDNPGFVDRLRSRFGWFDHIMRMNERFSSHGGNQHAAGITYFSVLSLFPLAMLIFAIAGFALDRNPQLLEEIQDQISNAFTGEIGNTVNGIVDTAIAQRGAILGIGGATALWSGLGWMNNLRFGVSRMWGVDPTEGNFITKKLTDLVALIILIFSLVVAFGITVLGTSGITRQVLGFIGLSDIAGIGTITWVVAVIAGALANFLVFFWLIKFLPRTKVPLKSGIQAAALGAIALEVVKQLGSLLASNALSNPAGVAFGPIIGIMVIFYLVWRILMYCSAWAATSTESLKLASVPVPPPAVIRVRNELPLAAQPAETARKVGIGMAAGAIFASIVALIRWK